MTNMSVKFYRVSDLLKIFIMSMMYLRAPYKVSDEFGSLL